MKRLFDVVSTAIGMVVLSPIFLIIAVAVKVSSKGPIFYKQKRVGRNGQIFSLLKFRSMVEGADKSSRLTPSQDTRITRVGRILRKTNLDELPQLFNVFKGDLSLVGPRPEVPEYVEMEDPLWQEILSVRPGMTSEETLVFRREGEILASFDDPDRGYREKILPKKMALARDYAKNHTFCGDIKIIFSTFIDIVRPGTYSSGKTGDDLEKI